ncbi:MAG TPA: protein kinase [Planctomycetaceae bacterium]|nr:protein kinase [Planctomycetaceae bacterium]
MTTKSVETFLGAVRKSGLIAPDLLKRLLDEFRERGGNPNDAERLADKLVAAGALTRWQAEKLLQGKHSGFFLGKYRLLSLLGKGGMSSVYLAEHVLMRRRCAIKVLPTKRVNDSSYLGRFHREAQAVAALDHSNIVRAYDVDKETQRNAEIHFLVMEYVEGQSLLDLVQKHGPLDFVRAADYIRQSAEGLAHAHAAGMVHRDVKPGNLLVDSTGTVKILDLGLARFFHGKEDKSLTVAHDEKVLGTADYLAPEQARDSHGVDARADIYGLGCTFYFLLTGHPPFSEGTLAQRLLAHQFRDPPPLTDDRPDTPPALIAVVERMMAKHPDQRFQSSQETADALVDWLHENAGEEWRRRNPGLSGSGSGERRPAPSGGTGSTGSAAHPPAEPSIPAHPPAGRRGTASERPVRSVERAETVTARDSSTTKGRPQKQSAAEATRSKPPPEEPAAAPAGDDSALATFLTNLQESPTVPRHADTPAATAESEPPPTASEQVRKAGEAAPVRNDEAVRRARPQTAADARPVDAPTPAADAAGAGAGRRNEGPPPTAVPVARAIHGPGSAKPPAAAPPAGAFEQAAAADKEIQSEPPAVPRQPASGAAGRAIADAAPPAAVPRPPVAVALAPAVPVAVPAGPERKPVRPAFRSMSAAQIALGAVATIAVAGLIYGLVTSGSNGEAPSDAGQAGSQPPAVAPAPVRDPRKLIGKDIHVGPAGTFKTINEALTYVREHFQPLARETQTIRVAGGLSYPERLDLTGGGGNPFPAGVSLICSDPSRAILDPVGEAPVVKLAGVQRFTLEGFEIRGSRPTAVELAGFLEGTRLKNLEIAGFAHTGLLGRDAKGTFSVGARRNELLVDQIVFRGGSPQAVGLRLEGETGRVQILRCRFLPPLATGLEIGKEARYLDVRHTVFANMDVGVRFVGQPLLTSVTLAHNTFHKLNRGIVFPEMPAASSSDLAFYRNLFDEVAGAEAIVEIAFDQRQFERMLSAGGPDQNWTTRTAARPAGAIDLFTTGGRQAANIKHVSMEPGDPKFLAPAAGSPHAQVPAAPGRGLDPYIGAVAP